MRLWLRSARRMPMPLAVPCAYVVRELVSVQATESQPTICMLLLTDSMLYVVAVPGKLYNFIRLYKSCLLAQSFANIDYNFPAGMRARALARCQQVGHNVFIRPPLYCSCSLALHLHPHFIREHGIYIRCDGPSTWCALAPYTHCVWNGHDDRLEWNWFQLHSIFTLFPPANGWNG